MQVILDSGTLTLTGSVDVIMLQKTSPKIELTLAAPRADHTLIIIQGDAGTAGHTVTLTSGAFDTSGHKVLTFNAANECIILHGESANLYLSLVNIGSVGLS